MSWYWFNGYNYDNYSVDQITRIESEFLSGKEEFKFGNYHINFTKMTQQNIKTLKERAIIRKPIQNSTRPEINKRWVIIRYGNTTEIPIFLEELLNFSLQYGRKVVKYFQELHTLEFIYNLEEMICYLPKTYEKFEIKCFDNDTYSVEFTNSTIQILADSKLIKIETAETCSICLEEMTDEDTEIIQLPDCKGHCFHKECIGESLNHNPKCPLCNKVFKIHVGNQPYGIMKENYLSLSLEGYENYPIIEITYIIPEGIQKEEHYNPGFYYSGTIRKAYLPDNDEGKDILRRLKIAFQKRLIFTIGTSLTTSQENSVVWNGIHHKTNLQGAHGYPDPEYLGRVKSELENFGIY